MRFTDESLIKRCLEGEKEAFGFLVEKYRQAVYALAYSKVGNQQDAEDITQEAFLNAYKNLGQFRAPYKFNSWLYVITSNCCKMLLRRRAKEREKMAYLEDLPSSVLSNDFRQKQEADGKRAMVAEAIAKLPEDTRSAINLYYFSDLSGREIAEFMGISHANVRVKLHRGRKQLRGELRKMMEETAGKSPMNPKFTFNIVSMIQKLAPPSIPKPKWPLERVIPIGTSVALLVFGILLRLGVGGFADIPSEGGLMTGASALEVQLVGTGDGQKRGMLQMDRQGLATFFEPTGLNAGGKQDMGSYVSLEQPTVREILEKMQASLGTIRDIRLTIQMEFISERAPIKKKLEYQYPGKFRTETEDWLSITNGDKRWSFGGSSPGFVNLYAAGASARLDIEPDGMFQLLSTPLEEQFDVAFEGTENVNGRDIFMLALKSKKNDSTSRIGNAERTIEPDFMTFAVTAPQREKMQLGVDAQNYLPVYKKMDTRFDSYTVYVTKWGRFGEVEFPVEYELYDENGELVRKTSIADIEINPNIPPERFEYQQSAGQLLVDNRIQYRGRDAYQKYQAEVKAHPNDASLRYRIVSEFSGYVPLQEGLEEHANKLLKLAPDNINAHYEAGRVYLRAQSYDKALAAFQFVEQRNPKMRNRDYMKGQCYEGLGQVEEAFKMYQQDLEPLMTSSDPTIWGRLSSRYYNASERIAEMCQAHGKGDELMDYYARQQEKHPKNTCLPKLIGDFYYALGETQKAAEAYRQMFALITETGGQDRSSTQPEFSDHMKNLGLHAELANYLYEKAQAHTITDYEREGLVILYAKLGDIGKLLEIYRDFVKTERVTIDIMPYIRQTTDESVFIAQLENYISEHPEYALSHQLLGDVYRKQENIEIATALYEAALQIDPNVPAFHLALAKIYIAQGRYEDALEVAKRAMLFNPKDPYYATHLAYVYNRLNRHDDAIELAQAIVKEYPGDPAAYIISGCVYFNAGKYRKAVGAFESAAERTDYPIRGYMVGRYLATAQAKAEYEASAELDIDAIHELIQVYSQKGDTDAILKLAQDGIRRRGSVWKRRIAHSYVVSAFRTHGRLPQLVEALEAQLKTASDNFAIYGLLGYAYMNQRNWAKSQEMYEKALPLATDKWEKGEIYEQLGLTGCVKDWGRSEWIED